MIQVFVRKTVLGLSALALLAACGGTLPNNLPGGNAAISLPLKLSQELECDGGSQLIYEISAKGEFKFLASSEPAKPTFVSRQLSENDQKELLAAIAAADLVGKLASSQAVDPNGPQTLECRAVDTLSIQVSGQSKSFDRNGRKLNHKEDYRQAFDAIRTKLDALKSKYAPVPTPQPTAPAKAIYALPLKVRLDGECGLPDFTRFEVNVDGLFTWTREDWPTLAAGSPPTEKRNLNTEEKAKLIQKLQDLQILNDAQASKAVPADAPQTKECRTVTVYDFNANGKDQSIEAQGTRKFEHSKELLAKFAELQKYLYELSGQKAPEL